MDQRRSMEWQGGLTLSQGDKLQQAAQCAPGLAGHQHERRPISLNHASHNPAEPLRGHYKVVATQRMPYVGALYGLRRPFTPPALSTRLPPPIRAFKAWDSRLGPCVRPGHHACSSGYLDGSGQVGRARWWHGFLMPPGCQRLGPHGGWRGAPTAHEQPGKSRRFPAQVAPRPARAVPKGLDSLVTRLCTVAVP